MHGYVLCPTRCPMGRKPDDAVIRAWLAGLGWRAPTHVKDGIMWVGDAARGEYLSSLVDRSWVGTSRPPQVGIREEV
jgi:hypothetical protein